MVPNAKMPSTYRTIPFVAAVVATKKTNPDPDMTVSTGHIVLSQSAVKQPTKIQTTAKAYPGMVISSIQLASGVGTDRTVRGAYIERSDPSIRMFPLARE